jgi:hypothetical protein
MAGTATAQRPSERAARRRGELHCGTGDRRVAQAIRARLYVTRPHLSTSRSERALTQVRKRAPWQTEITSQLSKLRLRGSEVALADQRFSALAAAVRNHEGAQRERHHPPRYPTSRSIRAFARSVESA